MNDDHHSVRIEPQGRTLHVPAGQPVLLAAFEAGLNLPHSCRTGHCSSCIARLRSGSIRYPRGRPLGITPEEVNQGKVLLCQALACTDLVVEARSIGTVGSSTVKTLPARIGELSRLAPDVVRLRLRLPPVEPLRFEAGQYLDILLPDGQRRSYSIASPPHDTSGIELHVRQVAGGAFSGQLGAVEASQAGASQAGAGLGPGALLSIEGPLGQFTWTHSARAALLIAGGTGYAPLRSMLRHALECCPPRPLHLCWLARDPAGLYARAEVEEWCAQYPQLRFTPLAEESADRPEALRRLLDAQPGLDCLEVYAAGPPSLIKGLRAYWSSRALPAALRFDSFDSAVDSGEQA